MRYAPPPHDFPRYPVSGGTILLASVVSILQWRGQDVGFLHDDPHVMMGQVWRLVTSALPHANILHLLFNVYWVWNLGALAEAKYGSLRTAMLFVYLAAVSGGAEYLIFDGGQGLSGVGYGLFGLFWSMRGLDRDADLAADKNTAIAFLGWGVLCVVATYLGTFPVANIAHGMGLVAGMVVGRGIVSLRRWQRLYYRVAAVLLLTLTVTAAALWRPYLSFSSRLHHDLIVLSNLQFQAGQNEKAARTLQLAAEKAKRAAERAEKDSRSVQDLP